MKKMLIIPLILFAVLLSGCTPSYSGPKYVIQKQSMVNPTEWDNVIDVYGFVDDYSVAQDIVKLLDTNNDNYRVVTK